MATQEYDVVIKLVGNRKPCHSGHKVGDEWIFDFRPVQGMCAFAYNSLFPFAVALKSGGTFPWQSNPDVVTVSCPDGEVSNLFEIRRSPKK